MDFEFKSGNQISSLEKMFIKDKIDDLEDDTQKLALLNKLIGKKRKRADADAKPDDLENVIVNYEDSSD